MTADLADLPEGEEEEEEAFEVVDAESLQPGDDVRLRPFDPALEFLEGLLSGQALRRRDALRELDLDPEALAHELLERPMCLGPRGDRLEELARISLIWQARW